MHKKGGIMRRLSVMFAATVGGIFLLTVLYGCGGQASTTLTTDNSTTVVRRVLAILLGSDTGVMQGNSRAADTENPTQVEAITRQDVSLTEPCNGGQVSFVGQETSEDLGTVQSFTIDGTVTFTDCLGINGRVTVNSAGTADSNQIILAVTLNGSVSAEGCTINFNGFSADTTATATGIINSPIIVNGALSATCDGDSIACTLNNVDLDDFEAFDNGCKST
jgi:hypothetical protein